MRNRPSSRFNGEIRAQTRDDRAELLIFGDIGDPWDPESPQALDAVREISATDASVIEVRVNSYGGGVADGLAIYNALLRHPARIEGYVEGAAASIASVILMAADEIQVAESSLMMVHAPWGFSVGNATEMRDAADMLDRHATALARAYARRDRVSDEQAQEWVSARSDFWFDAQQAIDAGLADGLSNRVADGQLAAAMWQRYSDRAPPLMVAAWVRDHKGGPPMAKRKPAAAAAEDVIEDVTEDATDIETADLETEDLETSATDTGSDADEIAAAALVRAQAALAARNEEVSQLFTPFAHLSGIAALERRYMSTEDGIRASVADVRAALLAHLGKGAQALGGAQFDEDPHPPSSDDAPVGADEWSKLVKAKRAEGLTGREAIKAAARENPEAHAAMLRATNPGNEHLVPALARVS